MKPSRLFLCIAFSCAAVFAQEPAAGQKAEEAYKNIQLFRGMPASRIPVIMDTFNTVLGVECVHCHVDGEWEKEDKPQFGITRNMMRMVLHLSANHLKEVGGIACWSCHRGQPKPSRFPGGKLDEEMAKWPVDLADSSRGVKLAMSVYNVSLGVGCDHCHTPGDWKSDAKEQFHTARVMVSMFSEFPKFIPEQGGRMQCWTCHKGSHQIPRSPPR